VTSTRERIIEYLQQEGSCSVRSVSEHLGVSLVGARQQLQILEAEGKVEHTLVHQKKGRPYKSYHVPREASEQLPNEYESLAMDLVRQLRKHVDSPTVRSLLHHRNEDLLETYKTPPATSPMNERVEHLACVQRSRGYVPLVETREGVGVVLQQCHCMVFEAAQELPELCEAEHRFFEQVTGAHVQQIDSRRRGDRCCSFRFVPQSAPKTKAEG